jgi:hypothetical protein
VDEEMRGDKTRREGGGARRGDDAHNTKHPLSIIVVQILISELRLSNG